jgi:hypothetical protein
MKTIQNDVININKSYCKIPVQINSSNKQDDLSHQSLATVYICQMAIHIRFVLESGITEMALKVPYLRMRFQMAV